MQTDKRPLLLTIIVVVMIMGLSAFTRAQENQDTPPAEITATFTPSATWTAVFSATPRPTLPVFSPTAVPQTAATTTPLPEVTQPVNNPTDNIPTATTSTATPEADSTVSAATSAPETTESPVDATASPEMTEVLTATPAAEITEAPVPETTETAPPEITAEVTPEVTATPAATDQTPSPEITTEVTSSPDMTATLPVDVTAEVTVEVTVEVTLEVTLEVTAEVTPEAVIPMATFEGEAHYQNRQPDDSGIQIMILDGGRALLSQAVTDSAGRYSVLAPTQDFFWLVIDAPLHRRFELGIWPGEPLPAVKLMGGDLDGDGCVAALDIAVLTMQFNQSGLSTTDINGDTRTDAADLAILAGNYDPDCGRTAADPTSTPVPVSPTPGAAVTSTLTPVSETSTPTLEATAPAEVTPESGGSG